MSFSVKTTIRSDTLKAMAAELNTGKVASDVGDTAIQGMKTLIAAGISPVRAEPRFTGYLNPIKYPNKQKPARPVNLNLSGEMLDALDFKISGGSVTVGIFDSEQSDKAETHQQGLNGVPQRRFIPDANGEELAVTINNAIGDVYDGAIADIIRRTK